MASKKKSTTFESEENALFKAVQTGDAKQVEALLAQGADASSIDATTGRPCLHEAVLRGFGGIAADLLEAGADINARDGEGCTALLHVARGKDSIGTLKLLLQAGADPNAARINSRKQACDTPLHHRCDQSDMQAIGVLLELGADPLQRDAETGKTPFQTILSICKGVQRQVQVYVDLPRVDMAAPITRAAVLKEDDEGLTPLANPLTWQKLPAINAQLEQNGEQPIGKAEAFSPAADGLSPMARLGRTSLFDVMVNRMQAQGERLSVADFLSTPETAAMLEKPEVLGAVFSLKNARLGTTQQLNADRIALPQKLRGEVRNYHQLYAVLQQEEEADYRKEYGRRRV